MPKRKRASKKQIEDDEDEQTNTTQDEQNKTKPAAPTFAFANSDFEVNNSTIYNLNTKENVEIEKLAQFVPTMGKQQACIKVRMLDKQQGKTLLENGLSMLLPEQGCSLEVLKQRHEEAMALEAQLEAVQQEIVATKSIVRAVMKKMNSRLAFANLGHDIICKIYEYCCSLPLSALVQGGMDSYSKKIRKCYTKNVAKIDRRFDKHGNLNPMYFSLICKTFAEAVNHKPCALIIRKATSIPSETYLNKIDTLPLLCTEPNRNLSKKLISIESKRTDKNGLFYPVNLILECKRGVDSVPMLLSKYSPQILTLSYMQIVPQLTSLPSTIHTISIIPKKEYRVELVVRENLLKMLKASPSVHTVVIKAELVMGYFLEGVLKLDHVKHVDCSATLTDIPFSELPELIEKYHSLGKTIKIGVPESWDEPFGLEKRKIPKKYTELEPYITKGIVIHENNAGEYGYKRSLELHADYTDYKYEKAKQDEKKEASIRRKSYKNKISLASEDDIDEELISNETNVDPMDYIDDSDGFASAIASFVGAPSNDDDEDDEDVPIRKRARRSK